MKCQLFFLTLLICFTSFGQIRLPDKSPRFQLEQKVGLTDIHINYSRPSKKGRKVFGELVPYGNLWRTGANENTTIRFSDDVSIHGKVLKAGEYAIFTKPGISFWEVIFYDDVENWGLPQTLDPEKVKLKVKVPVLQEL